ncbi:sulfatase [Consotaella aegiceratis]|uniref:sulfatase n=1 Tax=Consotaella aegiceratis TaxID=3097961 RepID=UPI002F3F018F
MVLSISRRNFIMTAGAAGVGAGLAAPALAAGPRINISRSAARPDRPNVVVIVIDTLRRDHLGIYGNRWMRTTALDQLGRQSLRFTRATPEAMPTIPARRSIHSGMRTFPFRNWTRRAGNRSTVWGWQHIPDDQPTLAEQMAENGYQTMLVSDVPHEFTPGMNFTRGFNTVQWMRGQEGDPYQPYWSVPDYHLDRYLYRDQNGEEITTKLGDTPLSLELRQYLANTNDRKSEEDHFTARVFRAAARVLENYPRDKPFFLTVDSFDPHEPWDAPRYYVDLYDDPDYADPEPVTPRYGSSDYLTPRQLQRMRALYAAEVTLMDHWLGFFMEQLDEQGFLDSTLVILTSDHGMALGEHDAVGKPAYALWGEMTDTPFFIRHPNGTGADTASDYFASTFDIAPTVLSLAGIAPKTELQGADLSPHLDGKEGTPRPHFTSGLNDYVWASDKQYTLIARNDGSEAKLYDIVADPDQTKDLADERPQDVRRLFDLVVQDAGGEPLPSYDEM